MSAPRTLSRERRGGEHLGDLLEHRGQLVERVRHAADEQQHEEQAVGRGERGFGSERPGHEHPDAGERDRAEQEKHGGEHHAAGELPTEQHAGDDDHDGLHDLDRDHVDGLRREQPTARQAVSMPRRFNTP